MPKQEHHMTSDSFYTPVIGTIETREPLQENSRCTTRAKLN